MNQQDFMSTVLVQLKRSDNVLAQKGIEYATDADRLHNFKVAAKLQGVSPRVALAGMMAKHTVSVYDMCMSEDEYVLEIWDEKLTDHINYLLLLACIVQEESGRDIPGYQGEN